MPRRRPSPCLLNPLGTATLAPMTDDVSPPNKDRRYAVLIGEAPHLISAIEPQNIASLRDRAIIGILGGTQTSIDSVIAMQVRDYYAIGIDIGSGCTKTGANAMNWPAGLNPTSMHILRQPGSPMSQRPRFFVLRSMANQTIPPNGDFRAIPF